MPTPEIEEFAKLLVENVRDAAIRNCDGLLRPRVYRSPTNPRRNDDAVPHVASSLRRFGWQQPIVPRRSGEVVAGNTRLKAAQDLGMTEVPVW